MAHGRGTGNLAFRLGDHTELTDQIKRLLHVQIQRFKRWINSYIVLVKAFALGDPLKSLNGPTDELRYIVDSCQYLRIRVLLYKLEQLPIDHFDTGDLISILIQYLVLAEDFVLFSNILLSKRLLKFISSFL